MNWTTSRKNMNFQNVGGERVEINVKRPTLQKKLAAHSIDPFSLKFTGPRWFMDKCQVTAKINPSQNMPTASGISKRQSQITVL